MKGSETITPFPRATENPPSNNNDRLA
jgi:hypothetical protein